MTEGLPRQEPTKKFSGVAHSARDRKKMPNRQDRLDEGAVSAELAKEKSTSPPSCRRTLKFGRHNGCPR